MTDEIALRKELARAARAQALIGDELLTEAFSNLEKQYVDTLFQTNITDQAGREKLFLAVNVLRKVKDHLARTIENGTLAQRELRDMAQLTEPQKTWAEV